ncbi:hypothetical protein EST38_g11839 [Candolleomyces aberdarensis]|uniref:DNA 3'-5' helicase n=1 Tax=Candolleomyces aberdarensis TaxID=2316362 RepID=A0A4Q2D666_9AGAR|nr:hypothetical protein EST38_g11839 [Candolleomyces aberdarensis]
MVKRFEAEDHADSDDMEEILEYTKHVHQNEQRQGGTSSMGDKDRDLKERIRLLEADVHQYNKDIEDLTKVRDSKASQLEELKRQLRSRHYRPNTTATRSETGINYQQGFFDWDKHLLKKSKDVFGIEKFRLCQRGCVFSPPPAIPVDANGVIDRVCNANMDGRDIVCVMPTGGGKSLTYQLPALLTAGCTIIISPLISLITDQVMNLKCHGVEAVMLMSTVSNSEKSDVQRRLRAMADGSGDMHGRREIKLCYVTDSETVAEKLQTLSNNKIRTGTYHASIADGEKHRIHEAWREGQVQVVCATIAISFFLPI